MECRRPFRESVQSQCKVHLPRLLTWKPVNFLNCHVNVTPNLLLPLERSFTLAYEQAAWLVHLGPVRCHRSSASLRRGPLHPQQCVLVWFFISSVPFSTSLRWQELRAAAEDVQVASETWARMNLGQSPSVSYIEEGREVPPIGLSLTISETPTTPSLKGPWSRKPVFVDVKHSQQVWGCSCSPRCWRLVAIPTHGDADSQLKDGSSRALTCTASSAHLSLPENALPGEGGQTGIHSKKPLPFASQVGWVITPLQVELWLWFIVQYFGPLLSSSHVSSWVSFCGFRYIMVHHTCVVISHPWKSPIQTNKTEQQRTTLTELVSWWNNLIQFVWLQAKGGGHALTMSILARRARFWGCRAGCKGNAG